MLGEDKKISKIETPEEIKKYSDMLLKIITNYNPYADLTKIKKAIDYANNAHIGQKRASGESYIIHPLAVADVLTKIKADTATICAGILHDVVEDTSKTIKDIEKEFGKDVANIVSGVTKTQQIYSSKEEFKAENLRKMLLASAKDPRVMLVKLADRMHNMHTLKHLRPDKQKRIATETMEIYAPIAEKLGMWRMKGRLEDLSLRYIEPETYQILKNQISEKREIREKKTQGYIKIIQKELKKYDIEGEVYGRAKYFNSIYKKMKKYNKNFDEIYDLIAIRIIVKTIPECYTVLNEIVLKHWKLKTGRLKDYIKDPKDNNYQSIHATVETNERKLIEIQIRTREMHITAEDGVAAHWRYKETERDKQFDRKISWMKQVLDWKRNSKNAKEFVENLKINLFQNEIVVLTPQGDPISLPNDATPVDFAYEVHTNIGNACQQAKVNGQIVSLDTKLNPGDIIEIITKQDAHPSRQWLNFVKTSKAKSKIKNYLGLSKERVVKEHRKSQKIESYSGDLTKVVGIIGKKCPLKLSKCCNPKYGDLIKGFYTKDKKITIHKADCSNVYTLINSKKANVYWTPLENSNEVKIQLLVQDKLGILAEILNILSENKVNLIAVNTQSEKNHVKIQLRLSKDLKKEFEKIMPKLKKIEGLKNIVFGDEL